MTLKEFVHYLREAGANANTVLMFKVDGLVERHVPLEPPTQSDDFVFDVMIDESGYVYDVSCDGNKAEVTISLN